MHKKPNLIQTSFKISSYYGRQKTIQLIGLIDKNRMVVARLVLVIIHPTVEKSVGPERFEISEHMIRLLSGVVIKKGM